MTKNNIKNKKPKGRYNFLMDESVYLEFSRICGEKGIVRSKNLENYMKQFINEEKQSK